MDVFKDRLSRGLRDSTLPPLAHQSRGRALDERERALAEAMMEIYGAGEHDFDAVARQLAERGVVAPRSGRTDWTRALLADELAATNAEFDALYKSKGYGA